MSPGIVILVLAVAVAVGFGLHRRRLDGRFGGPRPERAVPHRRSEQAAPVEHDPPRDRAGNPDGSEVPDDSDDSDDSDDTAWSALAAALPHAARGERATLVQFSSAFCAPCRVTRVVLGDVAERVDGVVHLEVDAEQHLELVRALDVRRTPTTLVLDRSGAELARAAGAPRREQVLAALPFPTEEP